MEVRPYSRRDNSEDGTIPHKCLIDKVECVGDHAADKNALVYLAYNFLCPDWVNIKDFARSHIGAWTCSSFLGSRHRVGHAFGYWACRMWFGIKSGTEYADSDKGCDDYLPNSS